MSDPRTAAQRYEDERNEPPKCERCQGTGEVPNSCIVCGHINEWFRDKTCPACAGTGLANCTKGTERE